MGSGERETTFGAKGCLSKQDEEGSGKRDLRISFENLLRQLLNLLISLSSAADRASLNERVKGSASDKASRFHKIVPLGPYIKDVSTGRGEGGSPKADIVREVAWIYSYRSSQNADKGGGGPKSQKFYGRPLCMVPKYLR